MLKNFEAKPHIDKSITPKQSKFRIVPFHIRHLVEKEIENMLANDVIEPVTGPTPWVSPIVSVPKEGRPNEIRICTDAREANKAIMRSRHTMPTVDDLLVRLNGVIFFSKLLV